MPPPVAFAPWIALVAYILIKVRLPRPLPVVDATDRAAPLASVIVPARNEERSIRSCVESICASDYPDFEVIVVDDGSDDATLELARAIPPNHARRVVVVEGHPLLGRQIMETFWERLLQTHMMAAIIFRFPNPSKPRPPERWRGAIANGQFMLFDRGVYDEIGGHEAVKGEIVEDQRLAQILCRSGKRLTVRAAETVFATRMYRSLDESIKGWSKNLSLAARQAVPPWAVPIVMPAGIVVSILIWIAPPRGPAAIALRGRTGGLGDLVRLDHGS